MEIARLASRISTFSLFIAASLLVGWFIPRFYIWTDSDQSRPSPLLWQVPLGSIVVSMAFCVVLPWLPIANQTSNKTSQQRLLFSIRTLLLITASGAGLSAARSDLPYDIDRDFVPIARGTATTYVVMVHPSEPA